MKRLKNIGILLLCVCMFVGFVSNDVYAASASVSVSSTSANVGNTVTINCTASMSGTTIGVADIILQYDPAALQVVGTSSGASANAGSVYYSQNVTADGQKSLSFSVNFKILKEGTFGIRVTSATVWSYAGDEYTPSIGNGSVTGKAVTTNNSGTGNSGNSSSGNTGNNNTTTPSQDDSKDKNSKLNNLLVHPGTMSPSFNQGTTSYKVEVPADTTAVTISATAQSNKATVSVSGGKDLQPGENAAKVVVTAENGSVTVYNITIICGEEEKEIIQVNGVESTIDETFTDDKIPEGFVREKITYNGKEYEALKHEKGDLHLVSLQNDTAGAVFYIYNEVTQEFYNFVQVQISEGKNIIPLPLKEIKEFANFELVALTLKDKSFDAWKVDDEYSLLPFLTIEGEEVIYQYDSVDGTLQRYAGPVSEVEATEPVEIEKPFWEEYSMYIIAGLIILVIILIIAFLCVAVEKKNRHSDEYGNHAESCYVEPREHLKEVEEKPKKKKRKHDARRRKAIKRLQKQKMKENR